MSAEERDSAFRQAAIDIVGGTCGGVGIVAVGHPFDTLKVRLQTQSVSNPVYNGLVDCVVKTYRQEGIRGYYRGYESPLLGQMLFNAVQFASYTAAKDFVKGQSNSTLWLVNTHHTATSNSTTSSKADSVPTSIPSSASASTPLTIRQCFAAGALTGFGVSFVECPIDSLKCKLQTQVMQAKPLFTTFTQAVRFIVSNFGLKGVFHGLTTTIARNVPAVSCYFGAYEWCKLKLATANQRQDELETWKLLTAGAAGQLKATSNKHSTDQHQTAL